MTIWEEITGLVRTEVGVLQTLVSLFKLETKLAGLSIYPLLLTVCMMLIVLSTTWGLFIVLLGYGITLFIGNTLISAGIVLFLHLILITGLLKYLSYNLKKMSFEKTREFILNKENHHAEKKKITE